jgi:iron complex outermembrane receptor protein
MPFHLIAKHQDTKMKMSYPKPNLPFAAALSGCFVLLLTAAVPVSAQSTTPDQEKTIQLSAFEVHATQPSPYQVAESTSGNRIAVPIFLTTQAVDVVTGQLISDLGADHMLDSAQYVSPGVSNGSQSVGADRVTIRGFQSDLHVSDGFINVDLNKGFPQINESFEIVKGPSALLSPFAPQPGGTINWITKKPSFSGNFGSTTVEYGQWDSNFGSLDINRVLSPHLAVRVVMAGVDDKAYTGEKRKGGIIMPEVTWRLGTAQFFFQAQIYNYKTFVNSGVPLDYTIGSNSNVSAKHMIPVNSPWNPYIVDSDDIRNDLQHNYLFVFTDKFFDALSVRVAAHASYIQENFRQFNTTGVAGAPSTSSMTNPLTGAYTPGFTYGGAATGFAATAVPIPTETGAVWTRSASSSVTLGVQYDFQNDWNYEFSTSYMKSDSTAGVAVTWYPFQGNRQGSLPANGGTKPNFDLGSFVHTAFTYPAGATAPALNQIDQEIDQYYISEELKFFKDRLVLNGSLSENEMTKEQASRQFASPSPNPLQPNPATAKAHKLLKGYGIVVSPIPYVALYYGHSETSLPIVAVNSAASTSPATGFALPPTQDSKQDEAGIRFKTLDGRSTASVDYFQAYQSNNSIPNPANLALAVGQAPFPLLFADVVSRGWEYEFNTAITPQLSILGTYTHFQFTNAYGQSVRAVAQTEGAIYANYRFTSGTLKGFQAGIGAIHVSRRAVDNPSAGSTAAGTPTSPIVFQPTAWLPAYTVVNLTSSYQLDSHWKFSAYVDNVLNEYYFTGGLNRFNVFTGAARGYRGSVTYSF